jgi:hypothetical protein
MKSRESQADGEAHVAPGELLVDEGGQPRLRVGLHLLVVEQRPEADLVVLLEAAPEHRFRRDHVRGIGEAVELDAGRPQDLLRELVGRGQDLGGFFREPHLDVDRRHPRSSAPRPDADASAGRETTRFGTD